MDEIVRSLSLQESEGIDGEEDETVAMNLMREIQEKEAQLQMAAEIGQSCIAITVYQRGGYSSTLKLKTWKSGSFTSSTIESERSHNPFHRASLCPVGSYPDHHQAQV